MRYYFGFRREIAPCDSSVLHFFDGWRSVKFMDGRVGWDTRGLKFLVFRGKNPGVREWFFRFDPNLKNNYTKLSGLKDVSFSNCINRIAKRTSDFLDASERNVMNVVCAPGTAAIVSSCRPAFCLRWRKLFRRACSGCLAVAFSGGARGRPVPGDYRICRKRGIGLWRYGFRIFPTDTELFGCAPPELPGVSWIVFAALRMIPTVAPAYSSVR